MTGKISRIVYSDGWAYSAQKENFLKKYADHQKRGEVKKLRLGAKI